jgi:hypothetical protein
MSYPWVREQGAGTVVQGSFGSQAPAVQARIKDLPHEIRDEDFERDKPGYRGFLLQELRGVLALCDQGDEDDPRWPELRLRALDRVAKLLRVYEPDAPSVKAGPGDARILAGRAAAALKELETSLAETRGPVAGS